MVMSVCAHPTRVDKQSQQSMQRLKFRIFDHPQESDLLKLHSRLNDYDGSHQGSTNSANDHQEVDLAKIDTHKLAHQEFPLMANIHRLFHTTAQPVIIKTHWE